MHPRVLKLVTVDGASGELHASAAVFAGVNLPLHAR
jgi:hypothetical protein